ncbi:MAG: hypothetical protein DME17_15280 [Candidatus Rokuibacteriota bacterium]|nr:MAG: hypothetical protein DME17_15280 [Candidatus Rokubacteria bacterium]
MRFAIGLVLGVLAVVAQTPVAASDDPARRAADSLVRSQLPSGLFTYGFDFLAGAPLQEDNIVRQVGIVYFLAEFYLHSGDESVRPAIQTGLSGAGTRSVPFGKGTLQSVIEHTGVLSLPAGRSKLRGALDRLGLLGRSEGDGKVVTSDNTSATAFAGTTALALLAELQYYRASRDDRFAQLRSAWLKGLLTLHVPRRGFRLAPRSIEESDYFNGEGWLALAYYQRLFPQDEAAKSILSALDAYLMARHGEQESEAFYHWGTMAAATRFATTSDASFLKFIKRQAELALNASWWKSAAPYNTCGAMEGLVTAVRVLESADAGSETLTQRLRERIRDEMKKNRRLQIPPGAERLQLGRDTYLTSPHLKDYAGAFLEGPFLPSVRIDYTGHCLSAMVKLERYRLSRSSRERNGLQNFP